MKFLLIRTSYCQSFHSTLRFALVRKKSLKINGDIAISYRFPPSNMRRNHELIDTSSSILTFCIIWRRDSKLNIVKMTRDGMSWFAPSRNGSSRILWIEIAQQISSRTNRFSPSSSRNANRKAVQWRRGKCSETQTRHLENVCALGDDLKRITISCLLISKKLQKNLWKNFERFWKLFRWGTFFFKKIIIIITTICGWKYY